MAVPFIIGAIVAGGAALFGAAGHAVAKDTNEEAQRIAQDAQEIYNDAKSSLEAAQLITEKSLLTLGYSKQNVLNGSIQQFLRAYQRIKNIEISDSIGLDEISNFTVDKQDTLQLREMSDVYQSSIKSGVAGAAAGTVIALAASGSLPIVTGALSTAGTALAIGEVGIAASLAGSALSFGAAMTPLAAIAAPVVLFTGISASIKADENLEKANAMHHEAQLAVEKMETAETLCYAISDRSDMFNELLINLNGMFSYCTGLLDALTMKKTGIFKGKTIDANKLSEDELKLIAVTRALAGAVKAVIDTPILGAEGNLTDESKNVCNKITEKALDFNQQVSEIKNIDYSVKPKALPMNSDTRGYKETDSSNVFEVIRGVLGIALGIGFATATYVKANSNNPWLVILITLTAFSSPILLFLNNNTKYSWFKAIKGLGCLLLSIEFCVALYFVCTQWIQLKYFWWVDIPLLIISFFMFGVSVKAQSSPKQFLLKVSSCTFFLTIAPIVFVVLNNWIGISFNISLIITEILYGFFALVGAFMTDTQ